MSVDGMPQFVKKQAGHRALSHYGNGKYPGSLNVISFCIGGCVFFLLKNRKQIFQ